MLTDLRLWGGRRRRSECGDNGSHPSSTVDTHILGMGARARLQPTRAHAVGNGCLATITANLGQPDGLAGGTLAKEGPRKGLGQPAALQHNIGMYSFTSTLKIMVTTSIMLGVHC